MEYFIGSILPWAGNYPPAGWLFCQGQLIPISANTALFSILGTSFGGDGKTTFALPDLRNMLSVGSTGQPGEKTGLTAQTFLMNATIGAAHVPPHSHPVKVTISNPTGTTTVLVGTADSGGDAVAGGGSHLSGTSDVNLGAAAVYLPKDKTPASPVTLGGVTTTLAGGSATVSNSATATVSLQVTATTQSPALPATTTLNHIICVRGIFPPRN